MFFTRCVTYGDRDEFELAIIGFESTGMASTTQTTKDIEGISTDVVIQQFADRILVLVTQLGKVGNLVRLECMLRLLILTQ